MPPQASAPDQPLHHKPHTLQCRFHLQRDTFNLKVHIKTDLRGITAIFGPSGSGKTSFLRCLAGLERAKEGFLSFGNRVWQDEAKHLFVPPFKRPLGMVFQEGRLFDHLTVADNLAFAWQRASVTQERVTKHEIIEILELGFLLHRRPNELSGGERQRVAIGRALLTAPEWLLMDEPLASVDRASKQRILGYIRQLHRHLQRPVLYVSHDMGEIMQLADDLILMENGRILEIGPVSALTTRLDLPLAHAQDASALIETEVIGQEERFHLTRLVFGQGLELRIPSIKQDTKQENRTRAVDSGASLAQGQKVRVRIFARDVSLTRDAPQRTSILNVFPATVVAIHPENPAQRIIKLDVSGIPILALVTTKSCEVLALRPGLSLFAQVKSVALQN